MLAPGRTLDVEGVPHEHLEADATHTRARHPGNAHWHHLKPHRATTSDRERAQISQQSPTLAVEKPASGQECVAFRYSLQPGAVARVLINKALTESSAGWNLADREPC